MAARKIVLTVLCAAFVLYTTWVAVTADPRLVPYLLALRAASWGTQILLDLVISLGLVCTWLIGDARRRGRRAWPWVVATPIFGSLSPLLYLVVREWFDSQGRS
jgi:hypothetical protein